MPYHHIETEYRQVPKKPGAPCGDSFLIKRTPYHTTIILADGIGSGIRAHVASQMNMARLWELLKDGGSLRDAFMSVVGTMSRWRDHAMPFSAFMIARILNDGVTTVLNYEMPAPVLVGLHDARVIRGEPLIVQAGVASEHRVQLHDGEGILLVSDGITQSGLGGQFAGGWTIEGVSGFVNGMKFAEIPKAVMVRAKEHDGEENGDDRSVLLAYCRPGKIADILTGPPASKSEDAAVTRNFLSDESIKVICGATTADIVARNSGRELDVEQRPFSWSTPPRYFIEGIDLVTEGAVTLTQVFNIIEEDVARQHDRSAASDLAIIILAADWIRFTVGLAKNPANTDLVYRKQGILTRDKIIPLLADKLENMGKLVTIEYK